MDKNLLFIIAIENVGIVWSPESEWSSMTIVQICNYSVPSFIAEFTPVTGTTQQTTELDLVRWCLGSHEFFRKTPIWTVGTCLDPTYETHERTPIKYMLNWRFILPSLTKPYTGPLVSFFSTFHSEACMKWWQASRRLWRVRWRRALERRDPTDPPP